MRALLLAATLASCATRVHAETFVKRNFGFSGPREITLVGPNDDVHAVRLELQKHGFDVLQVGELGDATTRYVAEIGGVCNWRMTVASQYARDAELHIFVTKRETRERVFSARLDNNSDCPDAFFVEAARAIVRNWPAGQTD